MTMFISEDSKDVRVLDRSGIVECTTGRRKCRAKYLSGSRLIYLRTPRRMLCLRTVTVEYVRIVKGVTGTYCAVQNNTEVR